MNETTWQVDSARFEGGAPEADFDCDGFITGVDYDLYVQAFEKGCG